MHGPDVFISYAREDEGMARRFAEAFAQEGLTVWWDAALHSGETFDEVIEQELRASKAVVVLWSPHSVASRWVRAEATLADRNRTLAPAVIAPCNRPIIFELTHTADLSNWKGDVVDPAWKSFVKDIRRMVANGRAKDAAAASEAAPPPAPEAPLRVADLAAGTNNVESLLSAVAALQEAIMKQNGHGQAQPAPAPAPAPPPPAPAPAPAPAPQTTVQAPSADDDDDDSDATQFYTHGAAYSLMDEEVHCLEVSLDGELKQRYAVGPLGLKIGRVAPADIVLADSKVSRSHCMVELKEGELFVADLSSTNGTFVDGQRVAGAAILPLGATLTVGHYSLVHELRKRSEIS
ncbi:MAG: TIR domain-containing protein [Candidatus Andeanibacterium colombiense]|uniref:TIR domain-containing protein n=1 Tax=Candidatus Andeanibacterium colombiense TaxID=3121345 RepID=A0AAJ6BMN8_9SPHN|nr:MAG: TIR domain-containing protein [Sphingomonadaceae bacterium]